MLKSVESVASFIAAFILFPSFTYSECIPFDQADKHIGENRCVTGKVIRVEAGEDGAHHLDFCGVRELCPFSVVVYSYDLKNVGDVRQLAGKVIEIRGELNEYDDRAEIVLENARQLKGEAARLPPLARNFDVEQRGRFSAGKSRATRGRSARQKRQRPTLPIQIPEDVESE
jgi:small nuclear ribonucleoprotein (snRNP)-like protein